MISWLKQWLWYFLSAFAKPLKSRSALDTQIEQRANLITLSDRSQYKSEFMAEWGKPENIAARRKKLEEEAPLALERGMAMASEGALDPIPPIEELPEWMRNQSPSFIRRALKNGFTPEEF